MSLAHMSPKFRQDQIKAKWNRRHPDLGDVDLTPMRIERATLEPVQRVPFSERDRPPLRVKVNVREVKGAAAYGLHRVGVEALDGHRHVGRVARHAARGTQVAVVKWWRYAWDKDHEHLVNHAVANGQTDLHARLYKAMWGNRKHRLPWSVGLAALALSWAAAILWSPDWRVKAVLLAVYVTVAALSGRRVPVQVVEDKPSKGVSRDTIIAAFDAAGFGGATTSGGVKLEGKGLYRRTRTVVDLNPDKPHTASKVIAARETLAGRLRRELECVHLTRGAHPGQVVLTLLGQDPMAGPAIPATALDVDEWSMWDAPAIGVDFLGNVVRLPLLWTSLLVGAQPRMGKTFAMRLLCLWVALDVHARLYIWDGKGGGDYRTFQPICARYGQGHSAKKQQPRQCLDMLREVSDLVTDRNERIGNLPAHLIPEGKLTREVSRDPQYDLPLIFVVIDEIQRLISDPTFGAAIRDECIAIAQNAPSCGVILIVGAQRPTQTTGKGSLGDLPPAMGSRCAFKTMDAGESNTILGEGYAGAGWDSSDFPHDYEGVSILRSGADVEEGPKGCQLVKWACVDNRQLEAKMAQVVAARGVAVSDRRVDLSKETSFVGDLAGVFDPGDDWLWLATIAERLAGEWPDRYAGWDAKRVGRACRDAGLSPVEETREVDGRRVRRAELARPAP